MSHVREQLVDLGISEYGGQKTLDHLAEMEADTYRVKYKYISMDALRHIFLDLRECISGSSDRSSNHGFYTCS